MSAQGKVRMVGVDLQDSEENRALTEAIEDDNPEVTLTRMPGLVKLQTPGELVIRRETVETRMGRPAPYLIALEMRLVKICALLSGSKRPRTGPAASRLSTLPFLAASAPN